MRKNLTRTCGGYLLSYMGDTFIYVGLLTYIIAINADAYYVAALSFCVAVGKFIAIPIATYVDLNNKKKIMVICAFLRLVLNIGLFAISFNVSLNIIILVYFMLVVVDTSAEKAFMPYIRSADLEDSELNLVLARVYTATNYMNVIALATSGILMVWFGIEGILIINTIIFAVSFTMLLICNDYEGKAKKASLKSLKFTTHIEGIKFILRTKSLVLVCVFAAVVVAFLNTSINLVLPLLTKEYGFNESFVCLGFTIATIGSIIGASIVSVKKFNVALSKYRVIFIGSLLLIASSGLIGLVSSQVAIMIVIVTIGLFAGVTNTTLSINIVKIVPQAVLARASAAIGLIFEVSAPIAIPVFTILIKNFGISIVMIYGSIITFIIATIIIVCNLNTISEVENELA